jgi:hypothetical protein
MASSSIPSSASSVTNKGSINDVITINEKVNLTKFSDALLEKVGGEDSKKDNSSSSTSVAPDLMNNDLDLLKKLQTQTP